MGIFSSKIRTYVSTSVSKVNDYADFISSADSGALKAITKNEGVSENILNDLINGIGFRSKRAYLFSENESMYTFGRPNDTVFRYNTTNAAVLSALEAYLEENGAEETYYVASEYGNFTHLAAKELATTENFNFLTNELRALSAFYGYTVTLTGLKLRYVVVPEYYETQANQIRNVTNLPFTFEEISGSNNELVITYQYTDPIFGLQTATKTTVFYLSSTELLTYQYMYCYGVSSSGVGGTIDTFTVSELTNFEEIPSIAALFNTTYAAPGTYMPRLYFRWEFEAGNADTASMAYQHSSFLSKKIGINYDRLVDQIHTIDAERTAEDLAQIRSSFLIYAVEADTTQLNLIKYLYHHFEYWYDEVGGVVTSINLATFNANYNKAQSFEQVLVIEDKRFKLTVGMQGIWRRTVTGVIGPVGTYASVKGVLNEKELTVVSDGISVISNTPRNYFCYRKQVTATTYVEYQIVGLETKYYVAGEHYSASGFTENVEDAKDILYVPLNYDVVKQFVQFDQEEIYYSSMHIVTNSFVQVKVKWYQNDFFSSVLKVIAIYLLIMGFVQGSKLLLAIEAAVALSIEIAIEYILGKLYSLLIATIGTKLLVSAVGEEIAALIAIFLVYQSFVNGDSGKLARTLDMSAKDLANLSDSIFKAINKSISDAYNKAYGEFTAQWNELESKFDELKKLEEELNVPTPLANLIVGEIPGNFYNRTIHSGNTGPRVYELQHNYVDLALRLPRNSLITGA